MPNNVCICVYHHGGQNQFIFVKLFEKKQNKQQQVHFYDFVQSICINYPNDCFVRLKKQMLFHA